MKRGTLRIIGGTLRGRRLLIPPVEGLRPTPDRVRETLFNWLAFKLPGTRCLDAFAGAGALGFEALSRGASYVEMVDQSKVVVDLLISESEKFAPQAVIYQADVPRQLRKPELPFDIIFLDPPYHTKLLMTTAHYLEDHAFLANPAYIYLESFHNIVNSNLPQHWHLIKSDRAGEVFYHLAMRKVN